MTGRRKLAATFAGRTRLFFDRRGNPIPVLKLARRFDRLRYRFIARTVIGDVTVSTIWTGTDIGWGNGRPVIFETMVFGGPMDGATARCSTLREARRHHVLMAKMATQ